MEVTAQTIIEAAMEEIGVRERDEALDASDVQLGLRRLNMMLGGWAGGNLAVRAYIPNTHVLTPNVDSYTIGVGGAINTTKPYSIESAVIRDADGYETPLAIRGMDWYRNVGGIGSFSRPENLAYDPGASQQAVHLGTIYLVNGPDKAYTLVMDSLKELTEFENLDDAVTFEKVYYEYLMYKLAERLWRPFHDGGEAVPVDIVVHANQAQKKVETLNAKPIIAALDLPGACGGAYNIYTDQ